LSLPGLSGQTSNPCALDVTVWRNPFIAPPNLRMAQCASLIAPYESPPYRKSRGYWIARSSRAMTVKV
jgi:hypothetical protein